MGEITTLFWDVGGVLLTNAWDRAGRHRAAERFHLDWEDFQDRHELDSARTIVAHCRSGKRSAEAVDFLRKAGFRKVWNLKGGILAWSDQVDPSVPKY